MRGSDLAIAIAGGAAEGFFNDNERSNKEAKLRLENERQAKLLELKDQRIAEREMTKQKDQQGFEMKKLDKQNEYKVTEGQRKTAGKFMEDESKNEFERWKVGEEGANKIKVAEIGAAGKKGRGGLTDMQEMKLETDLAKLEDTGVVDETNVNRINTLRNKLGQPLYKKVQTEPAKEGGWFGVGAKKAKTEYVLDVGEGDLPSAKEVPVSQAEGQTVIAPNGTNVTGANTSPSNSKFSGIFSKVTGAASRVKGSANDTAEELPRPLPGTYK